jgi:uncharacterized protein (TIGR02594 family)
MSSQKETGRPDMRFKSRMMLVIGCVSLIALSVPALSRPLPHGLAHKQRADQKHKAAMAREERAARLVSMPISETPKRPLFGWPALVSEARKYLGTNPTARKKLWCATFMNLVLAKVGYAGTHSDAAKSFAEYGHRVSDPEIGAIAVLTRGKTGGHVGVVSGIDQNGNPIIISGNHGHQVGEAIYPRNRVIAYVMPSGDSGPGTTQLAVRSQPSNEPNRSTPEHHIESPIAELLAAIEAEQNRSEQSRQAPPQAQPAEPHRMVQQISPQPAEPRRAVQQTPAQQPTYQRAGAAPNPALSELFGLRAHAQVPNQAPSLAAPQSHPAPQRERQVQQNRPGRIARSDTGLAGTFSLR